MRGRHPAPCHAEPIRGITYLSSLWSGILLTSKTCPCGPTPTDADCQKLLLAACLWGTRHRARATENSYIRSSPHRTRQKRSTPPSISLLDQSMLPHIQILSLPHPREPLGLRPGRGSRAPRPGVTQLPPSQSPVRWKDTASCCWSSGLRPLRPISRAPPYRPRRLPNSPARGAACLRVFRYARRSAATNHCDEA